MSGEQSPRVPEGFLWGAATASYQIEGHPLADGAGPSIWHRFSHLPGKVNNGDNGDLACDHYHRWREDLEQMSRLGLKAYRFSVAWPRIFPEPGRLNPQGLDFYRALVDGLLERGIEPLLTIFHWDAPLWLEQEGGFLRRSSVERFCAYGSALFKALGDRVKRWITINEPMSFAVSGYVLGQHAPGRRNDLKAMFHASHHLLLAHGRLARIFREEVRGGEIGIAEHQVWVQPARPEKEGDLRVAETMDLLLNRFYLDPLLRGAYPEKILRRFGRFLPRGFEADLGEMVSSLDFVGLNYYTGKSYRHSLFAPYTQARETPTPQARRSAMWEVWPQGLRLLLLRLKEEYGNPPCYITENGYPLPETPGRDPLEDGERIEYLSEHIRAALQARQEGANLKGYFVWSLLDNFEWDLGYAMRFGLLRVDFGSLERTWRRSASWYRDLIQRGCP